jgi:hypothetical protein
MSDGAGAGADNPATLPALAAFADTFARAEPTRGTRIRHGRPGHDDLRQAQLRPREREVRAHRVADDLHALRARPVADAARLERDLGAALRGRRRQREGVDAIGARGPAELQSRDADLRALHRHPGRRVADGPREDDAGGGGGAPFSVTMVERPHAGHRQHDGGGEAPSA